jgi:hypothetical protein
MLSVSLILSIHQSLLHHQPSPTPPNMVDTHEQTAVLVPAPLSTPNRASTSIFPLLALPLELRVLIYTATLTTDLPLTAASLPPTPTLSSVHHHLLRTGTWNICLCSHQLFSESAPLRWDCLTLVLCPPPPSANADDDGRARLGAAEQPLRRRIRHLLISDRNCFGLCYGIHYCFHLASVTVRVDRLDGLFLIQALMPRRPARAIHRPRGRRLGLEVDVVAGADAGAPPAVGQPGPRSTTTAALNGRAQESWRRKWVARQDRFRFVFLNALIPSLPRGCRVMLLVRVTEVTMKVLRELDGFSFTARGQGKWLMTYDEDV